MMLSTFPVGATWQDSQFTGEFTQPQQEVKLPSRSAELQNYAFPHCAVHLSVPCLEATEMFPEFPSILCKQCWVLSDK